MFLVSGFLVVSEPRDLRHVVGFLAWVNRKHLDPDDLLERNGHDKSPDLVMLVDGHTLEHEVRLAAHVGNALDFVAEPVTEVDQSADVQLRAELLDVRSLMGFIPVDIGEAGMNAAPPCLVLLLLERRSMKPIVVEQSCSLIKRGSGRRGCRQRIGLSGTLWNAAR